MEIKAAAERTEELTNELLSLWEASVRATHHFLGDIISIRPQVRETLASLNNLVYSLDGQGRASGFMAVENGKKASLVDVNEHNTPGLEFYKRMGFRLIGRSPLGGNGNPFPILHLGR